MITSSLVMAVQSIVPETPDWHLQVGVVMVLCNLFVIAIGRWAIQNPGQGPDLPVDKPAVWKNFGIAELLATMSLGHILGAGVILGLSSAGVL